MNVSISIELEDFVATQIKNGAFESPSAVVQEALQLLVKQDSEQAEKLISLKQEIHKGLVSIEQELGKPLDIEAIKQAGRARLQANSH